MHRIAFEIAGLAVPSYGVALAVAFATGIGVACFRAQRLGLDWIRILDLGLVVLIGALVGSRLLFAATNLDEFRPPNGEWLDIVRPAATSGGLGIAGYSMLGGVVAAIVSVLALLRLTRLPLGPYLDVLAPSVALGEGITRIGCFLNGCCFGKACELPWAVHFPDDSFPDRVFGGAPVHPTQLYTSLVALTVFALLCAAARHKRWHGEVFVLFLAASGLARLLIDIFRYYPEEEIVGTLLGVRVTVHQTIALTLAVVGLAIWLAKRAAREDVLPT